MTHHRFLQYNVFFKSYYIFICIALLITISHAWSNRAIAAPEATVTITKKNDPNNNILSPIHAKKLVLVECKEMIDKGLLESIKRRCELAIENGADIIVFEIDTFGGELITAIDIWEYLIHDLNDRVHTIAYVPTKAISAGALISVACEDIIMRTATNIGDCAPISPGQELKGVEREKIESPTRVYFVNAAKANNYPVALCESMVTIGHKVFAVTNLETKEVAYFEENDLPTDTALYDLDNKILIVSDDELLTLDAEDALKYNLSRAIVKDIEALFLFIETRDNIKISRPIERLATNWSEEMVRWITSPAIAGVLLMIGMLGVYAEINSPGLGLPGLIAVIVFSVLFGSKFAIGMAQWWEIALFTLGIILLLVEIFVTPGFGLFGISGVIIIMSAYCAMMIKNGPEQIPLPSDAAQWTLFKDQLLGSVLGIIGFIIGASMITRYIGKLPFANKIILQTPVVTHSEASIQSSHELVDTVDIQIGDIGISIAPLRPAGRARINDKNIDVISQSEMIEVDQPVEVISIEGFRVIVKIKRDDK